MLRNDGEDAGRQSHVEESVGLFPTLLKILEMLGQLQERLISVVLARDVGAEGAEILQLLLDILGRGLDVGLHPAQVFLVVHLSPGIANDFHVLRQELVPVLWGKVRFEFSALNGIRHLQGRKELGTTWLSAVWGHQGPGGARG